MGMCRFSYGVHLTFIGYFLLHFQQNWIYAFPTKLKYMSKHAANISTWVVSVSKGQRKRKQFWRFEQISTAARSLYKRMRISSTNICGSAGFWRASPQKAGGSANAKRPDTAGLSAAVYTDTLCHSQSIWANTSLESVTNLAALQYYATNFLWKCHSYSWARKLTVYSYLPFFTLLFVYNVFFI